MVLSRDSRRLTERSRRINDAEAVTSGVLQDQLRRFEKIARAEVRLLFQRLIVTVVDEHGANAGGVAAIDIAPSIADHPAPREVDAQFARGGHEHSRLWLATLAIRRALARMKTHFDPINRQHPAHVRVNRIDNFLL